MCALPGTGRRPVDDASRLRILVLGYIVRRPLGGGTWPFIQYALGLRDLGHDVWFLEDSEDYPACYDPNRHVTDEDATFGLSYAETVFERHGLGERWAYFDAHKKRWHGPAGDRFPKACRDADLLVNISGVNPIRPWLQAVPRRVYVDTDPAFQQIRILEDAAWRERVLAHNVFFTYGENIPAGKALLPKDDIPWQPMRPPVVLDLWPAAKAPKPDAPFTTVMLWDSYAERTHGGRNLRHEVEVVFRPYLDLPGRAPRALELALGGSDAPRAELRQSRLARGRPPEADAHHGDLPGLSFGLDR